MKILITGFDPFGSETINPSYEAVKSLPDFINGVEIIKKQVPTVAYKSIEMVIGYIEEYDVDVVINVGQAGGRFNITLEKVAINLNDFRIPDNEGNQPINQAIDEEGDTAYFATIPINAMVVKMKEAFVPASISYTAGTFVCNHLMYGVLNYIHQNNLDIKAGFIHIPYMNEQVIDKNSMAAMSLDTLVFGLTKAIEAVIETSTDINETAGTIC